MNSRKNLSGEVADLWSRMDGAQGKKYWRTLEELADSEAFQEMLRREFPHQAVEWPSQVTRRQFLTLMGASLALAGLSGCGVKPKSPGKIVPYVRAPEEIVPGRPLFYATAMTLGGCGVGLLVESHLGRPTKIEGNPDHPASLGATDLFQQASILGLYDPDRSQTPTHVGETRTWDDAYTAIRNALRAQYQKHGAGLRILTETVVSPTLEQQLRDLLKQFPRAQWHQYEPLARDSAYQGAMMAFGKPVNTYYDFTRADVVVSFDCDFLSCGPGSLRYVADFTSRRRIRTAEADAKSARMNRLYVVESMVTTTGAKADHRLAVKPSEIEPLAWALAAELKVPDAAVNVQISDSARKWIRVVADDLRNRGSESGQLNGQQRGQGTTLVAAGDRQSPIVHLLAHAINRHLGNVNRTVFYTPPVESQPAVQSSQTPETPIVERVESLRLLNQDMEAGQVEILLIFGGNPVFTAPADFNFTRQMQNLPLRVHLSLSQDETSRQCHWHLPEAHYLEAWSDTRAYDGTVSISQPLIEPLYQGRSAHEVLAALTPIPTSESANLSWRQLPGYEIVKSFWRSKNLAKDFETFWETTVHDGAMVQSAHKRQSPEWLADAKKHLSSGPRPGGNGRQGFELVIHADPTVYDGRFANNGWLQELPKPVTELTWDNVALMSPATAKKLGIEFGSYAHGGEHGGYWQRVVELQLGERRVRAPAWVVPGHADECITVHLGYGRENAGRVGGHSGNKVGFNASELPTTGSVVNWRDEDGKPVGFNAYPLRTSDHLWSAPGLTVRTTDKTYLIACVQAHHLMENRECVRSGTLSEYHEKPDFATDEDRKDKDEETRRSRVPLTMYEPYPYTEHKWGMAIDLTACVGCKACVVACQAENNIPVVGKDQVSAGREMHWLRIDRYLSGPFEQPTEFHFQPVMCMHCENAPCEYVCPVEATVHSSDGLNEMIYQRCVGTRFCSNNCPYKVRRFNFFAFSDYLTESLRQQYNPDVTVRSRGVMEKCSYCVQRIRHAEIDSQVEGRSIFDGEILTACQAACPAQAIIFGDINDPKSKVKQCKDSPLHYALLADLNTEPRTTYLAALRNPNPALEEKT